MLAYSGLSTAVTRFEDNKVQTAVAVVLGLAGLAPSSQTVGSLLGTSIKIRQGVSSVNSLQFKNTKKYFSSNEFGKVKKLTHLPTTIYLIFHRSFNTQHN